MMSFVFKKSVMFYNYISLPEGIHCKICILNLAIKLGGIVNPIPHRVLFSTKSKSWIASGKDSYSQSPSFSWVNGNQLYISRANFNSCVSLPEDIYLVVRRERSQERLVYPHSP